MDTLTDMDVEWMELDPALRQHKDSKNERQLHPDMDPPPEPPSMMPLLEASQTSTFFEELPFLIQLPLLMFTLQQFIYATPAYHCTSFAFHGEPPQAFCNLHSRNFLSYGSTCD